MKLIIENLINYILQLSEALSNDNYANNRPLYTNHLAQAAIMLALIYKSNDTNSILKYINSENRSHGWSYISGPYGDKVNKAWNEFYNSCGVK